MESNKLLNDLFLTMRNDYAGWTAKQARHNPSPFVTMLGQAYYDRRMSSLLVLQAVNQYCAGMRDRNLSFALAESESYHPFSRGFTVRRSLEGMFVDGVTQELRLQPGDQVLAINRTAPERIVKNLPNPLLGSDEPEREQWNGYLKMAKHLTVRHSDGQEETLELAAYPLDRPAAGFVQLLPGGAVLLNPGCLDDPDAVQRLIDKNRQLLDGCPRLILDLRRNPGGCEEALLPLLPYLAHRDATIGELFGDRRIRTNYTKMNCSRMIHTLRPYLTAADSEVQAMARELITHYTAMSGQGWVEETEELCAPAQTMIPRRGPEEVILLTDTWCEKEAELLVQIAHKEGRAFLLGRPTMGTLDYRTPVQVRYDEFTFTYPMSRTMASCEGHGVDEIGISPDDLVPWTSMECTQDLLLARAIQHSFS